MLLRQRVILAPMKVRSTVCFPLRLHQDHLEKIEITLVVVKIGKRLIIYN